MITMAAWTWASVASRARSPREAPPELSTCPPAAESVQVDRSPAISHDCETADEDLDKRAKIIEHDGRVPGEWAEGYIRLDPDRPPADVPPQRWQQFVDDAGRFLDSGFAERAAALGWGLYDLFGCDPDRPFARLDKQGLCLLIGGNRLVDLSDAVAVIETWTGARQTYRRKPIEPGRVLAWELAP